MYALPLENEQCDRKLLNSWNLASVDRIGTEKRPCILQRCSE